MNYHKHYIYHHSLMILVFYYLCNMGIFLFVIFCQLIVVVLRTSTNMSFHAWKQKLNINFTQWNINFSDIILTLSVFTKNYVVTKHVMVGSKKYYFGSEERGEIIKKSWLVSRAGEGFVRKWLGKSLYNFSRNIYNLTWYTWLPSSFHWASYVMAVHMQNNRLSLKTTSNLI